MNNGINKKFDNIRTDYNFSEKYQHFTIIVNKKVNMLI